MAKTLKPVSIDQLKPDPDNPRSIHPEALQALGVSLEEFGDISGITWNLRTGQLVCGHQRLEALRAAHGAALSISKAKEYQSQGEVEHRAKIRAPDGAVYELRIVDWPKERQRLANMVANSPEVCGVYTSDAVGILEDLKAAFPELAEDLLLEDLLEQLKFEFPAFEPDPRDGLTDPDAIPEPPDSPTTRPGDLWVLGSHRLLCGDSADPLQVARLLDGRPIHLVNTDPPYNVNVEPRSKNAIAAAGKNKGSHQRFDAARDPGKTSPTGKMRPKDRPLQNDFLPPEEFEKLLLKWFGIISAVLLPGRSFYLWGGYANCKNYPPALEASKLYFSQAIIWVKAHPVLTRKDFMGNHEWCFYGWKEGAAHYFLPGVHNATDVWTVKKINPQSMVHLTEKPTELAERAMHYSSRNGENVLDLFGGSGSTLIAAERMERKALVMEIDPAYCDVIVQRWEAFTGGGSKLCRNGKKRKNSPR